MGDIYWIHEWAKVRRDEVVRLPEHFNVHEYFLKLMSKEDFEAAFKEVWDMYIKIYDDIARFPEAFGMPLYKPEEYNYFTSQARDSRSAAYRPFNLLYNLLISGDFQNGSFVIDVANFKAINKVRNVYIFFERFGNYGLFFEGLKNFKVTTQNITMSYPDNENVLHVLKLMADKAHALNRLNDFLCCHYMLFEDDMTVANYGNSVDIVAYKMHTKTEQEFIYTMDTILREKGYYAQPKAWNEGLGYAYYDKESVMKANGPYHYWMQSWKTKLILYLRIRNASRCMEYLKDCPDTVKQIFVGGDTGCQNRTNGTCQFGQEYTMDGATYWRCGCCNAPFHFAPTKEDIPYYIKLVEIGLKK